MSQEGKFERQGEKEVLEETSAGVAFASLEADEKCHLINAWVGSEVECYYYDCEWDIMVGLISAVGDYSSDQD